MEHSVMIKLSFYIQTQSYIFQHKDNTVGEYIYNPGLTPSGDC